MRCWQDMAKTIPAVNDGDPVAVYEMGSGRCLRPLVGGNGLCAPFVLTDDERSEVVAHLTQKYLAAGFSVVVMPPPPWDASGARYVEYDRPMDHDIFNPNPIHPTAAAVAMVEGIMRAHEADDVQPDHIISR